MKKLTSKLVVLMMVMAMAFGLVACGSKDDASDSSTINNSTTSDSATEEPTEAPTEEPTAEPTEEAAGNESTNSQSSTSYSSVEEYVNSPVIQNALSSLEESLKGSGMNIKISAEGNKMIYTYTYEDIEKVDGMEKSLEKELSKQDDTFQSTANQIKAAVNVDEASVVIEYVDSKGEMIYSKEYTSK